MSNFIKSALCLRKTPQIQLLPPHIHTMHAYIQTHRYAMSSELHVGRGMWALRKSPALGEVPAAPSIFLELTAGWWDLGSLP